MLLLLLGCERQPTPGEIPETEGYSVFWGDLHAHSGLSQDGCEDPDAMCLPDETLPGARFFDNAAANGLAFAAITDHAEFVTYARPADGVSIDIWDTTRAWVQAAEGGPVIPILGYEWTADGTGPGEDGVHRTVLLEDPAACAAYRIRGYAQPDLKAEYPALEEYTDNPATPVVDAPALQSALQAAADAPDCTASRAISFLHHIAEAPPAAVDWGNPAFTTASDTVVEIASEHGSSECSETDRPECAWHLQRSAYVPSSSYQSALTQGFRLGVVGGTDRHDADPGNLDEGPSATAHFHDTDGDGVQDSAYLQYTTGTLTGVIATAPLDRAQIFDALAARHTYAASWLAQGVSVTARSEQATYLPGDEVPSGRYRIDVALDDPHVESWRADVVTASGEALPPGTIDVAAGDAYYVRIEATVDGVEQRLWASPFFGP
jgi:hypothetical protein